jgi:hypothetical protein
VGGDGARWVKEGAELFGGLYELDRFHLKRALCMKGWAMTLFLARYIGLAQGARLSGWKSF